MKCRDRTTGHAFRISRLRVELLNGKAGGGGSPTTGRRVQCELLGGLHPELDP